MKKKIFSVTLVALVALSLSGCSEYNIPAAFIRPGNMLFSESQTETESVLLSGDEKALAERCFEKIEYRGLTLSLPMNVSDLPEGCEIKPIWEHSLPCENSYNGFLIKKASICIDGEEIADAYVFLPYDADISDGIIVGLELYSADGLFTLGESISTDITRPELAVVFGRSEPDIAYDLGDGRKIKFTFKNNSSYVYSVFISLSEVIST